MTRLFEYVLVRLIVSVNLLCISQLKNELLVYRKYYNIVLKSFYFVISRIDSNF